MKKITLLLSVLLSLVACNHSNKFTVSGTIQNAKNQTIYLAHQGIKTTNIIDSVKLNVKGEFKFVSTRPATPDFYALIYNNQTLLVAVDSTESINIQANTKNFATQFTIKNSPSTEKIRQLRLSATQVASVLRENKDTTKWHEAIQKHQVISKDIVLQNTHGLAAYFAIHQTLGEFYFLSPSDKNQIRYWQAVATGFQAYYPNSLRTKQLKQATLDALKYNKQNEWKEKTVEYNVDAENFIEIELPNRSNELTKLSQLKGKIVILDFMAFGVEKALSHNMILGELYEKYQDRGLEIYQVSLDKDKLFWLKASYNLPWICVFDENSANSIYARNYNVQQVPSLFIINKKGKIIQRTSLSEASIWLEKNL